MAGAGDVVALWLEAPRREIAYVKFVVESYEGVGVCRTIDPAVAIVVLIAAPDFADQARAIVAALEAEGACRPVPPPACGVADLLGPDD